MGSDDMEMRRNVGYMTQAFSLYGELTVGQNLELHAQLYHLPSDKIEGRIKELLKRYDLEAVVNTKPESLPLGIKQRLQLAVAVLHEPAILILDEPTSGVDPIARDAFWRTLIDLSRDDGVTIFLSTHFMNEAERCDRISLMHAGKVLAVGAPLDLVKERGSSSLEDTFVGYLADAAGIDRSKKVEVPPPQSAPIEAEPMRVPKRFNLAASVGLCAARDRGASARSDPAGVCRLRPNSSDVGLWLRHLFRYRKPAAGGIRPGQNAAEPRAARWLFRLPVFLCCSRRSRSAAEADRRLRSGNTQIVVEVPPGFGRDLLSGRPPEVDATVDGAMTFRGETARNYVSGVVRKQGEELDRRSRAAGSPNAWSDDDIQTRFRYNQAFLSVNAMVPSVFMLMLCLIPAIMSAIAVVREKETGSIANFRSTPITKFEFLLGKQLPYVAVAMVNFVFLAPDGGFPLRRAAQGAVPHVADRDDRLRRGDNRFRTTDLVLHPHAGRRGFRDRDPVDRAGGEFFRVVRAGFVVLRRSEGYRPDVPLGLVSAGHRRRLRQGAGHVGALAQHRGDRR